MNIEQRIAELGKWRETHSKAIHYCISEPDEAADDFLEALSIIQKLQAENKKLVSDWTSLSEDFVALEAENQQLREKLNIAKKTLHDISAEGSEFLEQFNNQSN